MKNMQIKKKKPSFNGDYNKIEYELNFEFLGFYV